MKKNIVYILGAGFSAPLGIPLMRNFIDKARQMRRGNAKYDYFEQVITLIRNTISAGVYFQHDSGNIEQALSLLEMKDHLENGNAKDDLVRFIIDVIKGSTPRTPRFDVEKMPPKQWGDIFTKDQKWQGYCSFVASISNLEFYEGTDYQLRGIKVRRLNGVADYSILSLNYDLLLENVCEFLSNSYWWGNDPKIHLPRNASDDGIQAWPQLVKIHGSVDTGEIIPPTFNKGLYGSQLPESWRDAYQILHRANEIRVIGYSLPQTDSYIKYLLIASVDRLKDLDRIDWIIRDSRAEVNQRVQEFIKFENKRFAKADTLSYLQSIFVYAVNTSRTKGSDKVTFNYLEDAHEEFMQSYADKTA